MYIFAKSLHFRLVMIFPTENATTPKFTAFRKLKYLGTNSN